MNDLVNVVKQWTVPVVIGIKKASLVLIDDNICASRATNRGKETWISTNVYREDAQVDHVMVIMMIFLCFW